MLGVPVHFLEVDAAEAAGGFAAEIDVFSHRHVRDGAQFLFDDGDAGGERFGGVAVVHFLAAPPDRAALALLDAHQDRKKRRFSSAVATAKRVNGAGLKLQAAVAQRDDSPE
ncbi:hypothetical protein D9M72_549510 [compost metagenome]